DGGFHRQLQRFRAAGDLAAAPLGRRRAPARHPTHRGLRRGGPAAAGRRPARGGPAVGGPGSDGSRRLSFAQPPRPSPYSPGPMATISGVLTAMVTPFDADGALD